MKNIFLIGMPSSGKSTIGKPLAKALNYQFIDMDTMLVDDLQKDIPSIFKEHGESYFRENERRILHSISTNTGLVIATGGGVPCFFDNMDYILQNGISVFIEVSSRELASRIQKHGKDDRPLLSGVTELEHELTEKLKVRYPYYSKANIIITPLTPLSELVKTIKIEINKTS